MIDLERKITLERLSQRQDKVILAIQDTTSFNFNTHGKTKGLGVIEDNYTKGFFAHTTLAVSVEGVPLGLFDQQVWTRQQRTKPKSRVYERLPITQKESMKWLRGLHETQACEQQVITIADREADIYDLFQEAHDLGRDYIIRATANRCVVEDGKVREALQKCELHMAYSIALRCKVTQETRFAEVGIRYTTLTLQVPQGRPKSACAIPLRPLTVQVVEVIEVDPPSEGEAIHWILYTTLPVSTVVEALYIVQLYSRRWLVERFHYVLKSGCQIEKRQLQSYDALTRFLALCSHQAWQLLELTYQARLTPDASCDMFLAPDQWQALQAHHTQTPNLTGTCPTLAEATRWIAQLGGFTGRNSDGQPGVKTLWRGWQRLNDLVAMWQLFHPPPKDVGND